MMYGMGYSTGYAILMGFLWLLLFIGIVLLVIWAVRASQRGHMYGPPTGRRDDACETARMRYARGEITREQYEEMCRVLEGRSGYTPPTPPTNPPTPPIAPPAPPAPPTNPPMAPPSA